MGDTLGSQMFEAYFPLLIFAIVTSVFAITALFSQVFSPFSTNANKSLPYECGAPLMSDHRMQFDVKFYLIAIIAVLFDVEIIFFFLWAVVWQDLDNTLFTFVEMALFILVLLLGYAFLVRKKAFRWTR